MQAKNFTERRKRIIAFAGIYAASIILLLFIFSAFGMSFGTKEPDERKAHTYPQPLAETELLHADSLLHAELQQLQQSDIRYSLLADSAGNTQRNNAAMAAADALDDIKKTIDSIQQMTTSHTGAEGARYAIMINTFKSVLNDRLIIKNTQASMAAGKTLLSASPQDMLQWKNELLLKDNDISRLQTEIKVLQGREPVSLKTSGTEEAQKGENELLKTAFTDQQKEYDELKDKYNRLKTDNSSLAMQLTDLKKAALQPEKINDVKDNRVEKLEQQVDDLNADLYFARIDCNLTRTDAQQIISNARQRKELLSESLVMLNSLSKSPDADIQKKAKEKIVRLKRIASTLHD